MATIPNPPTFTVLEKLTAALVNTNVRDAVDFLTAVPFCVLTNTAAQSIANNSPTAITFDTEVIDQDGMHSTTTATSRLTAVTPGWYMMSGNVPFNGAAAGSRWVAFQINGVPTSRAGFAAVPNAGTDKASPSTTVPVFLNVGDYVEMVCLHNSGAALSTDASTATGGVRLSALWVHS